MEELMLGDPIFELEDLATGSDPVLLPLIDDETEAVMAKRRDKNRRAAKLCRDRKKDRFEQLESENKRHIKEKVQLRKEIVQLQHDLKAALASQLRGL